MHLTIRLNSQSAIKQDYTVIQCKKYNAEIIQCNK